MHMADPFISPAVGASFWAAAGVLTVRCARQVRGGAAERRVPLMGVLGAFIFAAQMINFTIPGTGSSGHIGGALLLAILLGPHAAFLTIASVLTVQALFFADGGLLALGCNILNMGFFPCFIAYPLIYRKLAVAGSSPRRRLNAAVLASVAGLQLGAAAVVLETVASGISSLPLRSFLTWMLPIHLAIGVVEGLSTAAVVAFVRQARPEVFELAEGRPAAGFPLRGLLATLALAALLTAGVFSWFASTRPDGLEWAVARVTGKTVLAQPAAPLAAAAAAVQARTALLPDYDFKNPAGGPSARSSIVGAGTSVAGLAGSILTMVLITLSGYLLGRRKTAAPGQLAAGQER